MLMLKSPSKSMPNNEVFGADTSLRKAERYLGLANSFEGERRGRAAREKIRALDCLLITVSSQQLLSFCLRRNGRDAGSEDV